MKTDMQQEVNDSRKFVIWTHWDQGVFR